MKASILTALLWAPCCLIISKPASIPKHYQRRTALTPEQGPTFMLHKGTDKALSLEKGNSPIPVSGIKHGLSLFGFPQILWITPGLTQSNRVTAEAGSSYNDLIQRLLVPQHFEHLSEKLREQQHCTTRLHHGSLFTKRAQTKDTQTAQYEAPLTASL